MSIQDDIFDVEDALKGLPDGINFRNYENSSC